MHKDTFTFSRKIIQQITTIFFIEACASITFAVFFSGLSLYLTNHLHLEKLTATSITAVFLAFNYFLPLIGGIIANRFVSYKKLFLIGSAFSFLGCIALAYTNYFYIGFSAFAMTSLVSTICLNMFITQLFPESAKTERRVAFMWNYIGMNFGFMFGFILTGFFSLSGDYHYLFLIMSLFTLITIGLAMFFIEEPIFKDNLEISKLKQYLYCTISMLFIIVTLAAIFQYADKIENYLICIAILALITGLLWLYTKSHGEAKNKLIVFASYMVLATVFWSAYMLTPVAMIQIIENDVHRHVFGILLAPEWFQNIDSIIILLFGPMLAYWIKERKNRSSKDGDASIYFTTGLFFVFLAFGFFALGLYAGEGQPKLSLWIVLGYLSLMTLGEISIGPAGNALIGELIPENLRGITTGLWKMNMGIAVMVAGFVAKRTILPYVNKAGLNQNSNYSLMCLYAGICISVLIFVLLTKLIAFKSNKLVFMDRNLSV